MTSSPVATCRAVFPLAALASTSAPPTSRTWTSSDCLTVKAKASDQNAAPEKR